MTIWDNQKQLVAFGVCRAKARLTKKRLTFDCFKAHSKEARVYCRNGHPLNPKSGDGSMFLISVLKGTTSSQCKNCPDFDE